MADTSLEKLKDALKELPGIGEKTAERLAFHLISTDKETALNLSQLITESVNAMQRCESCNMITDENPCQICRDSERMTDLLCVVEKTQDVYLIEKTGAYKGRYFVLGNLISPIDGIGPNHINFPKLLEKIKKENISEVILALSPSTAGETTISFLTSKLSEAFGIDQKSQSQKLKITRLATGLPIGGDIGYTTSGTLASALKNRSAV
jgi:recombination protein RecR